MIYMNIFDLKPKKVVTEKPLTKSYGRPISDDKHRIHQVGKLRNTSINDSEADFIIKSQNEGWDYTDPALVYTGVDLSTFSSYLYRTLFSYDEEGKIKPDLSEDYGTPSADYKTWTFKLRKQCYFEDGTEILPSHIKYGIARTFDIDLIGALFMFIIY